MVESGEATIEDMDFLDCGRGLYLLYGGYLVKVGFDYSLSDQIPEELVGSYPKGTLHGVRLYIELSEQRECFL